MSVPALKSHGAAALVTDVPVLGDLSGKQSSALFGVAPCNGDSGQHMGQRPMRCAIEPHSQNGPELR